MMEIHSQKLNISDDERVSYDIIHRNDPVLVTDAIIENTDNNKNYEPLTTVGTVTPRHPRRLSTHLTKYPTAHAEITCFRNNGYKSRSPRKLGVRNFGRSCYEKLRSPEKLKNVDVDKKSRIVDSDGNIVEKVEIIEYSESIIPDVIIPKLYNENNHDDNDESDKDIFASQELDNRDEIINNTESEGKCEQLTPLKRMKEKLEMSILDDKKLFLTPQSVDKRSISSDSEYERLCDSIKNNNFDPGRFSFESMDLLNEFDDLDGVASNTILSNMLELPVDNKENKDELLTDPLAITPQKMNGVEPFSKKSSLTKRYKKRKHLNGIRRRSTRLQEQSNDQSIENVSMPTDEKWRSPQETNDLDQVEEKSSSNKQDKYRNLLNDNRRRSTRFQKESNKKPIESDSSSTDEELRNIRNKIKEAKKEAAIPLKTINRLKNLDIKLEHEPLPQHQLETYISRPPPLEIKKSFVQYGPMKKGAYSKSEDKIITNNWKRFCDIHDWNSLDVKPFINVQLGRRHVINNAQRIKFVQFLAQGLPWRLLYSVFVRFQLIYTKNENEQKYTPEEDVQIMIYMEKETKSSSKYSELAQLLKRTKGSIQGRYTYLKNRNTKRKSHNEIEWNIQLIEKFLKNLLKVTLSNDIYDLKNAVIPKIVWIELEKKLEIPHDTMMFFWLRQLHAQLFCTRPIYEIDTKIMLIEYLYVKGISNRRDIIWSGVAKHFDGLTPHYLSQQFYTLIQTVPLKRKKNLAGVIGWLYEKKLPELATKIKSKCLPRLIYKNGKIEIIKDIASSSSSSSSLESSLSD